MLDESIDEASFLITNLAGPQPGILSIVNPYSDNYVPKSSQSVFPKQSNITRNYWKSVNLFHWSSQRKCRSWWKKTRSQAKSILWFEYRAGKVTASFMKSVCHTDSANPAWSLVKSICYTEELAPLAKVIYWGISKWYHRMRLLWEGHFGLLHLIHKHITIKYRPKFVMLNTVTSLCSPFQQKEMNPCHILNVSSEMVIFGKHAWRRLDFFHTCLLWPFSEDVETITTFEPKNAL